MKTRMHEYKIVNTLSPSQRESLVCSPGNAGKPWQVKVRQFPDGVTGMWFDAGDPCDTRAEAEAKLTEFIDNDKGLRMREDGRWEPNE